MVLVDFHNIDRCLFQQQGYWAGGIHFGPLLEFESKESPKSEF